MKKKILSIILAITLVASMMTTAIVNVSATSDNSINENKVIHFDVSSAGWETATGAGVYCHIYRYDGTGKWPGWKSKAELCTYDKTTGIATYNIQTGVKKGYTDLETIGPNNEWCIMFVTHSGAETYPILMNSDCFNDTVYVPDKTKIYENSVDSEKKSVAARWKNHDLGAAKVISSTGKIQGDSFAYGETNETLLGDYLAVYVFDSDKVNEEKISTLAYKLGIKASDALPYAEDKINANDYYTDDEKRYAISYIQRLIDRIEDTDSGIYADELDKAYDDSGVFIDFYDDNDKLIGTCELKRYRNLDNTGWYYQGYCENVDITNGCHEIIKDGNGNEILYRYVDSSSLEHSSKNSSRGPLCDTLTVGIRPAISNITFTMSLSENYNNRYIKNSNYDIVKYNLYDYNEMPYLDNYIYDGTPKTCNIAFYKGYDPYLGKPTHYTLEKDKDYTVTYSNNINAGTATVTVTGIGNYSGTVTKEFDILKADQELIANMASTTLECGAKSQIVAIGEGDIVYTSSDKNVATVSNTGVVTAVGEGYAVITINALGNNNYNPDTTKIIVFVNAPNGDFILGDANGDGKVSILDATEIQKYLVGLTTFTDEQKKRADANGDGKVSILDATEIQKHLVGLASSLG